MPDVVRSWGTTGEHLDGSLAGGREGLRGRCAALLTDYLQLLGGRTGLLLEVERSVPPQVLEVLGAAAGQPDDSTLAELVAGLPERAGVTALSGWTVATIADLAPRVLHFAMACDPGAPPAQDRRDRLAARLPSDGALLHLQREFDELVEQLGGEGGGAISEAVPDLGSAEPAVAYGGMISCHPAMAALFEQIEKIKQSSCSVLITGETGTGKELVARALHSGGRRRDRPLEVVHCGGLSASLLESELFGHRRGAFSGADKNHRGVFERAHGGTVLLDEIADMSPEMQQKLLRVLQENEVRPVGAATPVPVDVRVLSTSRRDIPRLVAEGGFREDLYYRLNAIELQIPALRDRPQDVPLLIDYFLDREYEQTGARRVFGDSAMRELCRYSWPGNVQELRNVVTRAHLTATHRTISRKVVLGLIQPERRADFVGDDLQDDGEHVILRIPRRDGFNEIIAECERLVLLATLRACAGNKSRVTKQLGIPRQTLYNKIEKLGIEESDYVT